MFANHTRFIILFLFFISVFISSATIVISQPQKTQGTEIYVDKDATGLNSGESWSNAYTDLQDALASSTSGDQIWVAEGVYIPGTNMESYFQFRFGIRGRHSRSVS